MTVGKGIGRVVGKALRERIRKVAAELRPPTRGRPSHLDDTVREALEEARRRGMRPVKKWDAQKLEGFAAGVRRRMGIEFPAELGRLTAAVWDAIKHRAGTYFRHPKGIHIVKGFIAEQLIPHLPEFAALQKELTEKLQKELRRSARFADLDDVVHFVPNVTAANPSTKPGLPDWLQLTDGVMVAFSKELDDAGRPRRAVILAVIEAKSPKNYPDLLEEGLGWRRLMQQKVPPAKQGSPPKAIPWLGQFGLDFERFSELRIKINGWEFHPSEVMISRRKQLTRWVSVLPKGTQFADGDLKHLAAHGFQIDTWNLPVDDATLTKAAGAAISEAKQALLAPKP